MPAPKIVLELIGRFDRNLDAYRSGHYNETQVRLEFIDPFFKALGWDIYNEQGNAEAYKDVVHEAAVKVGGSTKAPDYSFRIGGTRKFFLEAKKPSVYIKGDPHPAFQLRRYAWSAKLPLSILTDFEELAIYDCRIRPVQTDKSSNARVMYLTYTEYADRWDDLYSLFSRDAVLKGDFDRFVASTTHKRGTAEVDDAFLQEIEAWRDALARSIALRNTDLSQHEVNFAVGRTIDRIIFLRICEDRGTEEPDRLMTLQNGTNIYKRLIDLYHRADEKYNSGLFHFHKERDRPTPPDELTLKLAIDDKVLKDIFKGLYYPESPYEFSVLPADILGQVYEQFLGKVIRLTAGHHAKVEDKPEVKKAGGVYYTPTYIVDYIVEHTVGKLLEGKTPRQAAKLRILDPACGSGSFLLGAYQLLLDWHRDWYIQQLSTVGATRRVAQKKASPIYQVGENEYRLTTAERKRILLNNIYGVDIDSQAVEVTKLSLLLKVLEGESAETINHNIQLFHERALPDLASNIKCGNSLIAPDFYHGQQISLLDEEERHRINVFDWEAEFPEIMKNGGFNAVIGNPPYGFHEIHTVPVKQYFRDNLISSKGSFEHYFLFYERSLNLLREKGQHGFIVPVTWLTIPSARSLREFVLKNFSIKTIAWLPELVFQSAQVNTLVSVIAKEAPGQVNVDIYEALGFKGPPKIKRCYAQSEFVEDGYYIGIFKSTEEKEVIDNILGMSHRLEEVARPCSGYNPYEAGKGEKPGGGVQDKNTVKGKPYHAQKKLGRDWKQEIVGRDLGRYNLLIKEDRWIKYGPWLAAPRDPQNFMGPRILVQEIVGGKDRRIVATYYDDELYHSRDIIPIKFDHNGMHPFWVLGVLNSYLITWYHHKQDPKAKKSLFPKVLVSDLRRIPMPNLDLSKATDKARHDRMIALVEQMLALHKQLAAARTEHDKTTLQRQIDATDRQIDGLVYELYGLTEEEIGIVESQNNE